MAEAKKWSREDEVYFAKLSEQAERYDEMAEHMRKAILMVPKLSQQERQLLAVAYKQAVGGRRAAWRWICNVEVDERKEGHLDNEASARGYRKKVEGEITYLCQSILALLTDRLIPNAETADAQVAFYKAQGDYQRYMAEISDNADRSRAKEAARKAYEVGTRVAEDGLAVTDPERLGLALNHAVFFYEVMKIPEQGITIARKAYEDAIRGLDTVKETSGKDTSLLMRLLSDNVTSWTNGSE